jgi:hypothetical protein
MVEDIRANGSTPSTSLQIERQKSKAALVHRRLELKKLTLTILNMPLEEGFAAIGNIIIGERK